MGGRGVGLGRPAVRLSPGEEWGAPAGSPGAPPSARPPARVVYIPGVSFKPGAEAGSRPSPAAPGQSPVKICWRTMAGKAAAPSPHPRCSGAGSLPSAPRPLLARLASWTDVPGEGATRARCPRPRRRGRAPHCFPPSLPSAALGVNLRLSNTVLPQFSRIPAHPPGQGTGYLGTDPHRSSWTDCLSLGQLVQSPVVSSSTQSSPAPRSSLLGTVLSALGMQSTEVTPITRVTAAREDGDEIQHGDHPSRSEKSGLGVCHSDRDWGQEEKGTTEDEMAGWHH